MVAFSVQGGKQSLLGSLFVTVFDRSDQLVGVGNVLWYDVHWRHGDLMREIRKLHFQVIPC